MAKFKPGQSGNPAGRPPGAKNRTTEQLRTELKRFIDENIDTLQESFDSLDPGAKFRVIDSMLKYVMSPPLSLDKLTEEQLEQLYEQIKKKYFDEQSRIIEQN